MGYSLTENPLATISPSNENATDYTDGALGGTRDLSNSPTRKRNAPQVRSSDKRRSKSKTNSEERAKKE